MDKKVLFEALNTELAKENRKGWQIKNVLEIIGVAPLNGAIGYQSQKGMKDYGYEIKHTTR